jgi:hypothetical protein
MNVALVAACCDVRRDSRARSILDDECVSRA